MPRHHVVKETPLVKSARVLQVQGMFDVPNAETSIVEWDVDLDLEAKPWTVGLIVGPSGAGKTTIAKELFGEHIVHGYKWSKTKPILDDFPKALSIKEISGLLTGVGLGSIPAWLRPFDVLSNGEQFRVTMARALGEAIAAKTTAPIVMDEFTSVVDRQVAKVAASCVSKAIRRRKELQFVAVTCHYDVIEWLQPDWIYQPEDNSFQWRDLQRRPTMDLSIHSVDRSAWKRFAHHHYMSHNLAHDAKCFGAFTDNGNCVAFFSYRKFMHPKVKNMVMGHRHVVLPDFQGLGIFGRGVDWLGQHAYKQGFRLRNVMSHPAVVKYCSKSPRWKHKRTGVQAVSNTGQLKKHYHKVSAQRVTSSFEYVPVQNAPENAKNA